MQLARPPLLQEMGWGVAHVNPKCKRPSGPVTDTISSDDPNTHTHAQTNPPGPWDTRGPHHSPLPPARAVGSFEVEEGGWCVISGGPRVEFNGGRPVDGSRAARRVSAMGGYVAPDPTEGTWC